MKKLLLVLFVILAFATSSVSSSAATQDDGTYDSTYGIYFSNGTTEHWYHVKFANSGLVMQGNGRDANVTLESADDSEDTEYWKLVGSASSFQLINKSTGYYAYFNGTGSAWGSYVREGTNPDDYGFALSKATASGYTSCFLIAWLGVGSQQYFNYWSGGTSINAIGIYSEDTGCPLTFIPYTSGDTGEKTDPLLPNDLSDYYLWYDEPATTKGTLGTESLWMEYSLPLGNGQIGATFLGGVLTDQLQLNEKTLWTSNSSNASSQGYYQNLGWINATDNSSLFSSESSTSGYCRYLDIINGVGGVNYQTADGSTQIVRRYFVSAPDQVFVAHYESNGSTKLNMTYKFTAGSSIGASSVSYSGGVASFTGSLDVLKYATAFKVQTDGTLSTTSSGITVANATYANVFEAALTNYDNSTSALTNGKTASTLLTEVKSRLTAAATKGYASLLADHVANHSTLMNRCQLNLGGSSSKCTDDLITYYNKSTSNQTTADGIYLENLYFQYGRYLEIGSNNNSSVCVPSNLQGIWNMNANSNWWHCDIHADINVQMNYWPCETTNLSEMHLPFLYHIINMSQDGYGWNTFAKLSKMGGSHGWTVAVENNIFGGSSTWDNNYFKTQGAWYCQHLWQHYLYTRDKDFLVKAVPAMYRAALYLNDIKTSGTNGYLIPNEMSPEHGNITYTAHAQQNSYELLSELVKAHEVLGSDWPSDLNYSTISSLYNSFDPGLWTEYYESMTCLKEWRDYPLSSGDGDSHRHMSHLMCLYPYNQVSPFDTDQTLFNAAKNSLTVRSTSTVTGWSMGWHANLWARALDGDRARNYLTQALKHATSYECVMTGGGCYYNLYDAHSPFQIDGNFGCCSGVAEMLLQSYDGVITLLPALPLAWLDGEMNGLKAVGNFTVDQTWESGALTKVTIKNNADLTTCQVRYPDGTMNDANVRVNGSKVTTTYNATTKVLSIPCATDDVITLTWGDEPIVTLGDANDDGKVTISDISTIINYINGNTPTSWRKDNADANQDNNVDSKDVSTVSEMILGK